MKQLVTTVSNWNSRLLKLAGIVIFLFFLGAYGSACLLVYLLLPQAMATIEAWKILASLLGVMIQGFFLGYLVFRYRWIPIRG